MAVTVLSLLALLALQAAAQQVEYFEIGKDLKLDPNHPKAITSITWKHKGNIVAEYIEGVVELEYLGDFKGRAKLDKTTGILTVKNMTKSDDGRFTVEINNMVLPVSFNAVGVKSLEGYPFYVIVRPLTCNSNAHNCSLSCGSNFTDFEPVQYFWKTGETGAWEMGQKTITIFNEEEKKLGFRTFTCRAKNLFSEKESGLAENPFYPKSSALHPGVMAVIIIVVLVIIIGLIAFAWFYYNNCIKKDEGSAPAGQGNGQKTNGDELRPFNPEGNSD